jgi:histidinol-phosphate aminotransferase
MLSPRHAVLSIPPYHPPLAGRHGLRLDFNENTDACSPRVLQRLQSVRAEDLAKYPECEPVEAQLADFLNLGRGEVLLTNGVDEGIHLLCQTYLEPGDEVIIPVPTYSMYAIYASATGAKIIRVQSGENFALPLADVKRAITRRTRLIAIANPNNPTGSTASNEALLEMAQSAPQAAVLIDEAYFEFHRKTILDQRRRIPNLFVARTFSKAYGMAGLRLGALVGDEEQMRAIRCVCSPYNVNALALACLPEALADQAYVQEYVTEVLEGRNRLECTLQTLGIQYWSSNANFVLCRVGPTKMHAATFVEQMRQRRVLVRDRATDEGCEGCVRITLGRSQHVDRLLNALQSVFAQPGAVQGVSRP